MTTNQVLVAAKGYLLTHGWMQQSSGDNGGPRCLMGAVTSAVIYGPSKGGLPECDAADAAIAQVTGRADISTWNDEPDRTLDDVIAVLDKAILATAPPLDNTPIFQALEGLPADDYIECLSVLALIPEGALA